MANGIKMPVKASKSGGVELIRTSTQKKKILRLAMTPGDDKNPFQSLGLREDIVFQSQDQLAASESTLEIQRILNKFKGKIGLKPDTPISVTADPGNGLKAQFTWVDLETNDEEEFTDFFSRAGGAK